jgi:hypothetical protein
MSRGAAGIYRRGGYAYARTGAGAVVAGLLDLAHEEAIAEEAARLRMTDSRDAITCDEHSGEEVE